MSTKQLLRPSKTDHVTCENHIINWGEGGRLGIRKDDLLNVRSSQNPETEGQCSEQGKEQETKGPTSHLYSVYSLQQHQMESC